MLESEQNTDHLEGIVENAARKNPTMCAYKISFELGLPSKSDYDCKDCWGYGRVFGKLCPIYTKAGDLIL